MKKILRLFISPPMILPDPKGEKKDPAVLAHTKKIALVPNWQSKRRVQKRNIPEDQMRPTGT